jgi:DNA-binding transcriptional MerR regulator
MLRLYSKEDIDKLRLIRYLESELGLNLAGVEVVLRLLSSLQQVSTLLENIDENDTLGEIIGEELHKILNSLMPNIHTINKDIHE